MSARKPSRPRLTPSTGTPCGAASRAACSIVPSPPTATIRSRLARQLRFRQALDARRAEVDAVRRIDEHAASAAVQMRGQDLHRLDDARVVSVADEGDGLERLGVRHGRGFSMDRVVSTRSCVNARSIEQLTGPSA